VAQPRLTSIGKYVVDDIVGEGAMGIVYRATDPVLNRRVAIKVMSDAIAQDADLRERFLREAQAAGSLQHPHVITIYDFGEVDGHLYIAMEYVEGEDLEDLLKKKVAVPLEAKLELIIGVLQGLAFAHKRGVIHRDIKPANIRIDPEGKARLMDFGVAHLSSSNMTRTGMMLGTPSYMAPEQIMGGPVSAQADIFSVGAVLYELLTGTRPFRGDTLQALMYQVLSTPPRPLGQLVPNLPPTLDGVVMRAMNKEPGERFGSALEMADQLATIRMSLNSDRPGATLSLRASLDTALAAQRALVDRSRRRREMRYVALGGMAVLAIGVAVIGARELTRRGQPSATSRSQATGIVPGSELRSPADSIAANRQATMPAPMAPPLVVREPSSPDPGTPAVTRSDAGRPRAEPSGGARPTAGDAPSARELALARSLQDAALENRRRAATAGASEDQLRAGDGHNDDGESLIRAGRIDDAARAFSNAGAAWTVAERLARQASLDREAAASSTVASAGAPPNTVLPVRDAPSQPAAADPRMTDSVRAPPPSEPSGAGAAAQPQGNPPAEIAAVVTAYARALESRDIAELRRVFPGMTASQQRAFEDFFRATRSLRASLTASDLTVSGATATARLVGTYDYVTSDGTSERRAVSFQAAFRRDDGAWRLTAVR
jgi:serine/threonine-protein kinase